MLSASVIVHRAGIVSPVAASMTVHTKATVSGDTDSLATVSDAAAVIGKAAIRERAEKAMALGTLAASISFDEVAVAGDWAFARGTLQGTWSPIDGGAPTQERNDNLWIMRREADATRRH